MSSSSVVTGYYRYTDIWFSWHSKIENRRDAALLKALLAHDTLCLPDHPFHVEGDDGVRLYHGMLETGEKKLLFSSAQIDYLRYWLAATGATTDPIPLPWSNCLLTLAELSNVTVKIYKTGGDVRQAIKKLDKDNKKLKGAAFQMKLIQTRLVFEHVRNLWAVERGVFCAIDFESWERDHKTITEFGYRLVGWKDGKQVEDCGHWIVKGHMQYQNTRWVQGNRDHYQFGESEIMSWTAFKQNILDLLNSLHSFGPVYLVFHDYREDMKYLRQLEALQEGTYDHTVPDATPSNGIFIVDTTVLLHGLMGNEVANALSLEKMCIQLRIPASRFHNAGNDAHYTLSALITMASGEDVDSQRAARWPEQKDSITVQPRNSDDDDSDLDDLYPGMVRA